MNECQRLSARYDSSQFLTSFLIGLPGCVQLSRSSLGECNRLQATTERADRVSAKNSLVKSDRKEDQSCYSYISTPTQYTCSIATIVRVRVAESFSVATGNMVRE